MTAAQYKVWLERIDSDLEFLRSSPDGRTALEALDEESRASDSGMDPFDHDRRVTIVPAEDDPGIPATTEDQDWTDGHSGSDAYVSIDPHTNVLYHRELSTDDTEDWDQLPPPVVVFHELAHAYDDVRGGLPDGQAFEHSADGRAAPVNRSEVNAVGMDLDGDGKWDLFEGHDSFFTENALRREMGVPERANYGIPSERSE
jgi:hypothetical protein